MEKKELAMVTHALATSRLHYCNPHYVKLLLKVVWKHQQMQNVVAHMLTGASRRDHTTPI